MFVNELQKKNAILQMEVNKARTSNLESEIKRNKNINQDLDQFESLTQKKSDRSRNQFKIYSQSFTNELLNEKYEYQRDTRANPITPTIIPAAALAL